MIGQTISHYRILEQIGSGGMGVVYKAHDTRLDRPVALKFLPPELTRDPEARARFVHEARAASALQHTNICVVHDIDETPDGKTYICMEYIDGETLRKKIEASTEQGGLKIEDVLEIAIQIARALAKVHAHGIVHRDIKPANIIMTSDGVAKVVDFGLAKLAGQARLTRTGSTAGTAAYMSPEQAQGMDTDHRTDVWSLGVVLYEMLTGRLPFPGAHEPALLYSIVNAEPEPIAHYRQDVPPAFETLIDRALEKDPNDRYQSAAEVASELRRIQRRSDRVLTGTPAGETAPSGGTSGQAGAPARAGKRRVAAFLLTGLLIVAAGAWFLITRTATHPSALNPELKLRPLKVYFREIGSPAISADGNWVVFPASDQRGKWGLYFMNAAGTDVQPVPTDTTGERIIDVDISPGGNWLVFSRWEERAGLSGSSVYLVPVTGGSPRRVDAGLSARWRHDGQRFGYVKHPPYAASASGNREFWTATADGKDPRLEFVDSASVTAFHIVPFDWSSDGQRVIWGRPITEGAQELFLRDLRTGKERQITSDRASIRDVWWARDDAIVYVSDKSGFLNLWMIAPDGGGAARITSASLNVLSVRGSAGGEKLLYVQAQASWSLHAAMVGSARTETLLSGETTIGYFDPSPDGTELAWETRDEGKNRIIVSRRDGTDRREIAQTDSAVAGIRWSSNGRMLSYGLFPASAVSGPHAADSILVYVVDPHALQGPRRLTTGVPITWADSATLLVLRNGTCWLHPADGSSPKRFFRDSTVALPVAGGKYAVYFTGSGETRETWITRVDGTTSPRKLHGNESADNWAFSPDGRFVTGLSGKGKLFRLYFPDGRIEPLRAPLPARTDLSVQRYSISRSGKEVFFARETRLFRMVVIDTLFALD